MPKHTLLLLTLTFLMTACLPSSHPPMENLHESLLSATARPEVLQSIETGKMGRPSVLYFYAPWCQVCRESRPQLEALAERYQAELTFMEVDMDDPMGRMVAARYKVKATPTLLLFAPEGYVLATIEGWPDEEGLELTLQQLLDESTAY